MPTSGRSPDTLIDLLGGRMYYVYLIVSEDGRKYIGYTANLRARIEDHNSGSVKSTKGRKWKLVYYEAYARYEDARRRERNLKKSWKLRVALYKRLNLR